MADEMIVIDEEEKNKLLAGLNTPKQKTDPSTDFLTYLTNPVVLQMFALMLKQLNQQNVSVQVQPIPPSKPIIKYDLNDLEAVLDMDQVQQLLNPIAVKNVQSSKPVLSSKKIETKTIEQKQIVQNQSIKFLKKSTPVKQQTVTKKLVQLNKQQATSSVKRAQKFQNDGIYEETVDEVPINDEVLDELSEEDNGDVINELEELNETDEQAEDDVQEDTVEEEPTEEIADDEYLTSEDIDTIDLTDGINDENIHQVEEQIKSLYNKKNKYLAEQNFEMVEQIDAKKKQIIDALMAFQKKSKEMLIENKTKLSNFEFTKKEDDENSENIDYLNLEIDPSDNYLDMKNIIIKCNSDKKVSELILVEYYLPANTSNITRFNNKFTIYANEKMYDIKITPAKYDIDALLSYVQNYVPMLELTIVDGNKIKIRNTMGMKFDLMISDDSIFPLLGFIEKADIYTNKHTYISSKPYNVDISDKITFCLSGTTMEPIQLETDTDVTANKVLKKSRNGFNLRQFILRFMTNMDQFYDFIFPVKMCFKIVYVSEADN